MSVQIEVSETKNLNSPSTDYGTFCGLHVTSATQLFCTFKISFILLFCSSTFPYAPYIGIALLLIAITPFYAVFAHRPSFMIPMIIYLLISVMLDLAAIFVYFISLCLDDSLFPYTQGYKAYLRENDVGTFYFFIIKLAFDAWFLDVSIRCEKYLVEIQSVTEKK